MEIMEYHSGSGRVPRSLSQCRTKRQSSRIFRTLSPGFTPPAISGEVFSTRGRSKSEKSERLYSGPFIPDQLDKGRGSIFEIEGPREPQYPARIGRAHVPPVMGSELRRRSSTLSISSRPAAALSVSNSNDISPEKFPPLPMGGKAPPGWEEEETRQDQPIPRGLAGPCLRSVRSIPACRAKVTV